MNNLSVNFEKGLIATGDDFGLVKLFRFPCVKRGSKCRKYNGHSAHVTNIVWTSDNKTVLSTGGADHALFQWRLIEQVEEHISKTTKENTRESTRENTKIQILPFPFS